MPRALVALGANLGDGRAALTSAVCELAALATGGAVFASGWYSATPIGGPSDQPQFLNGAVAFETQLNPHELLCQLHAIEARLGRVRDVPWGPRAIDLDLVYYDDVIETTPTLTVPHSRMSYRRFVLVPAAEIAPDWADPRDGLTIAARLRRLRDDPDRIALVGRFGPGGSFARELVAALPGAGACTEYKRLEDIDRSLSPKLLVVHAATRTCDPWTFGAAAVAELPGSISRNDALVEVMAAIKAMRSEPTPPS